jgi:hypothetical protein
MKKSLDGFAVSLQKSNPLTSPNIQEHVIHDKHAGNYYILIIYFRILLDTFSPIDPVFE